MDKSNLQPKPLTAVPKAQSSVGVNFTLAWDLPQQPLPVPSPSPIPVAAISDRRQGQERTGWFQSVSVAGARSLRMSTRRLLPGPDSIPLKMQPPPPGIA